MEIINVPYNTKLTITDITRKQNGIYMIIAENEFGKDEAEVEITVLGKFINLFQYDLLFFIDVFISLMILKKKNLQVFE